MIHRISTIITNVSDVNTHNSLLIFQAMYDYVYTWFYLHVYAVFNLCFCNCSDVRFTRLLTLLHPSCEISLTFSFTN